MTDTPDISPTTVAAVWRSVQGDPALLIGLTFGEFEDFTIGLIQLVLNDETMRRLLPIRLVADIAEVGKNTDNMIAWVSELTRLPHVSKFLDDLAS